MLNIAFENEYRTQVFVILSIELFQCDEPPTSQTDLLIFLSNKRLLAGTIYIRFLIYRKGIYGQKMKEIDFQLFHEI